MRTSAGHPPGKRRGMILVTTLVTVKAGVNLAGVTRTAPKIACRRVTGTTR